MRFELASINMLIQIVVVAPMSWNASQTLAMNDASRKMVLINMVVIKMNLLLSERRGFLAENISPWILRDKEKKYERKD